MFLSRQELKNREKLICQSLKVKTAFAIKVWLIKTFKN